MQNRVLALTAALALVFAACGDDDADGGDVATTTTTTTETSVVDDTGDGDATTSDTTDGDGDVDSDDPASDGDGSADELVALSGPSRVTGRFGDQDVDLELTEGATCSIQELDGEAVVSVTGNTTAADGLSIDSARLDDVDSTATFTFEGTIWKAGPGAGGEAAGPLTVRLTGDGAALVTGTFASDAGKTREAELMINCLD